MVLRRVLSALSVVVVASGGIVLAAPKKGAAPAPSKTPPPAPPAAPDPAATPAGGGSGSAVQPIEDTPPSDMNGTDENPDAPKGLSSETTEVKTTTVAGPKKPAVYPVEEALRPLTLLQNMGEVSISPHAQVGDGASVPYAGGDALRARFGITNQVQLGFTYVFAGIYPDPAITTEYKYGIHSGKAIGFDVTVQLQPWLAVKLGVPLYLSPFAASIAGGVPVKFHVNDKFAIGGLDDLFNISVKKFAPDYYQEYNNAAAAQSLTNMTIQSPGHIRVSAYGIYQTAPNVAIIGKGGVDVGLASDSSNTAGGNMGVAGGTTTFLRGGVQWSPRRFIDVGGYLGFDDLAHIGSFGPAGFLALRI
jgi:hypothetical protein